MHFDLLIDIARAKTCEAAKWRNVKIKWSSLVEELSRTERTEETLKQYLSYGKEKQGIIKDVGGFVGGYLLGGTLKNGQEVREPYGLRRRACVKYRQLVCLDVDFGTLDVWLDYRKLGFAGMFYTTHKHQPKDPRFRIVIPLDRPANPEEYEAAARIIASWLGIDNFDDTTYQPSRLMHLPSTSVDGEFLTDVIDAPALCVDAVLSSLDDWTDATTWPVSSRVSAKRQTEREAKAADPHTKDGLIGAFCRVYSIEEAINEFLPDVYTPCDSSDDRYTFTGGSTSGGLIIYPGGFAYSHHSTDPAGERLCNAFDLVRLHKFGDLDAGIKEPADVNKLPSHKAMLDFIGRIAKVKAEVINARKFDDLDLFEEEARETAEAPEWMGLLEMEKRGEVKNTINNVVIVLNNDDNLKGCFAFDEFEQREVILKRPVWDKPGIFRYPRPMKDSDDAQLRLYLEKKYGLTHRNNILDGLTIVMRSCAFNPVREYLDDCEWDGVPRLDTLFIDLFGADDSEYTRAVTRKCFVAAVARIYDPGCKFDYVTTLVGEQGRKKSTTIKLMGGRWFSDSVNTVSGREALEGIQGAWLIELGELNALKKAEVEAVKHFVSKTEDRFRVAYGRRTEHFPRRCVFYATTNEDDFLRDLTGNRRFWVINIKGKDGLFDVWDYLSPDIVAQLWGEAVKAYEAGETLYLSEELEIAAGIIQRQHVETDDRAGMVSDFISKGIAANWAEMDLLARRNWLALPVGGGEEREGVSVLEVWAECFEKDPRELNRRDSYEITRILKSIGLRQNGSRRCKLYGVQKLYK